MLLFIRQVSDDIILGLWKIEETSASFFHNFSFLNKYKNTFPLLYKSEKRLCEVLAVRVLIHYMLESDVALSNDANGAPHLDNGTNTGISHTNILGTDVALSHDANGAPHLDNGMNIGISHTNGYATVIISPQYRVSVDIERISNRVSRITDKFLRPDETANTVIQQLLHWCTKETLYKLYPEDDLTFSEMKVLEIAGNEMDGIIKAGNIKRDEKVDVSYRISNDFVLTFASL